MARGLGIARLRHRMDECGGDRHTGAQHGSRGTRTGVWSHARGKRDGATAAGCAGAPVVAATPEQLAAGRKADQHYAARMAAARLRDKEAIAQPRMRSRSPASSSDRARKARARRWRGRCRRRLGRPPSTGRGRPGLK
jgi:hypothetical protein